MGRPFVTCNIVARRKLLQFLLQYFNTLQQAGQVLLLAEQLCVERGNGVVLKSCQGFELIDALVHVENLADLRGMGSG